MRTLNPSGDIRLWLGYVFLLGLMLQFGIAFFDLIHQGLSWSHTQLLLGKEFDLFSGPLAIIVGGLVGGAPQKEAGNSALAFSFALGFIVFWVIVVTTPLIAFNWLPKTDLRIPDLFSSFDAMPKHLATVLDLVLALFFTKSNA